MFLSANDLAIATCRVTQDIHGSFIGEGELKRDKCWRTVAMCDVVSVFRREDSSLSRSLSLSSLSRVAARRHAKALVTV